MVATTCSACGPTTTAVSVSTVKFAAKPKIVSSSIGSTTSIAIVLRSRCSSRNSLRIIARIAASLGHQGRRTAPSGRSVALNRNFRFRLFSRILDG